MLIRKEKSSSITSGDKSSCRKRNSL